MAKSGITVDITDRTEKISKKVAKNLLRAVTDVTLDIKRVASESAPHKSGRLEKNDHSIKVGADSLEGSVSFSAKNKDFNYARWTHDADYNLGEKSKRKSGGKSKYGSGSIPVGKGYLANTVNNNRAGYVEHITDAFGDTFK